MVIPEDPEGEDSASPIKKPKLQKKKLTSYKSKENIKKLSNLATPPRGLHSPAKPFKARPQTANSKSLKNPTNPQSSRKKPRSPNPRAQNHKRPLKKTNHSKSYSKTHPTKLPSSYHPLPFIKH